MAGDEVVQAFFTAKTGSVKPTYPPPALPLKALFDFERVHVLQAAEVTFVVKPESLAIVDGKGFYETYLGRKWIFYLSSILSSFFFCQGIW